LQKAVSEGRRNEFKDFDFQDVPDPQSVETFERSKLNWNLAESENPVLDWYKALIALRKQYILDSERTCKAEITNGILSMQVPATHPKIKLLCRLEGDDELPLLGVEWKKVLSHAAVSVYVLE
jgi:maltooligosyltrehalose trehalohydrolase